MAERKLTQQEFENWLKILEKNKNRDFVEMGKFPLEIGKVYILPDEATKELVEKLSKDNG